MACKYYTKILYKENKITKVRYIYVIEETGNEDSNIAASAHDSIYRAQCSQLWVFCIRKEVGYMKYEGCER